MFRSFIGFDVTEFGLLRSKIELAHDEPEKRRLSRDDRKYEIWDLDGWTTLSS